MKTENDASLCGAWGGCTLPAGHNRGKADIPENHDRRRVRVVTEWAVRTAGGYFHTFIDEDVARVVHREQRGELLSRTVTYAEWGHVIPPAEETR